MHSVPPATVAAYAPTAPTPAREAPPPGRLARALVSIRAFADCLGGCGRAAEAAGAGRTAPRGHLAGSLASARNPDPVALRHRSLLWEASFRDHAGKPRFHAAAPPEMEAARAARERAEVQLVRNADWGERIAAQFVAMDMAGQALRTIRIVAPGQSMALGLQIKEGLGGRAYVAKLHDPHDAGAYRRTAALDPEALRPLAARDFVKDPAQAAALGLDDGNGTFAFLGAPLDRHAMQPVRIDRVDADTLHHLLHLGLAEGLRRFGERMDAMALAPAARCALLATPRPDGASGLYFAMENDHADAVLEYARLLLASDVPPEVLAEVLAARAGADARPGLYMALQDGSSRTIRAFGTLLAHGGLGPRQVAELLAARRGDGVPGLHMALQNGHVDAIAAFGRVLARCRLAPDALADLLAAKDANGTTGLSAAMRHGDPAVVHAYGDLLATAAPALGSARLAGLLQDPWPGASASVRRAYLDLCARFPDLDRDSLDDEVPAPNADALRA